MLDQNVSPIDFLYSPKPCVYGIQNECRQHEECVPKNSRARSGVCHCKQDYERDKHGYCQRKHSNGSDMKYITAAPSGESSQVQYIYLLLKVNFKI